MELDDRQLNLLKSSIREMAVEVKALPVQRAAARLETISILLLEINEPALADEVRHAACRYSEGDIAYDMALVKLEALK